MSLCMTPFGFSSQCYGARCVPSRARGLLLALSSLFLCWIRMGDTIFRLSITFGQTPSRCWPVLWAFMAVSFFAAIGLHISPARSRLPAARMQQCALQTHLPFRGGLSNWVDRIGIHRDVPVHRIF